MSKVSDFLAELNPFECQPYHASRIAGLGGGQPAPEAGYAFRTVPLVAPAGHVSIIVAFDRLQASRGTLLIEIIGGDGPERRQLGLRTVALAELAATGGTERVAMMNDRRETYAIAGYVYDDTDAVADGVAVRIIVSKSAVPAEEAALPGGMARVPRLAGLALPSFAHPSSQTWSRGQMDEPAYHAACRELATEGGIASWPEAYIYQALGYLLGELSGLRGFGASLSSNVLAGALQSKGAETVVGSSLDPEQWPPLAEMDFAWLVSEERAEDARFLFGKASALIDRVRPGGAVILVFPFEHGRMPEDTCEVARRNDVEILALRLLSQGHGVAQLKFRPADRSFRPGTRTSFGLMIRKVS